MMKKFAPILTILCSSLLLSACFNTEYAGTSNLMQLQRLGKSSVIKNEVNVNPVRYSALQDTALSLGAQAGLAWRAVKINKEISKQVASLDETYNFNAMLLDQDVLPPVLTEADDSLNLDAPDTIRLSAKTYKIVSQARFVTAVPTWRDYIWMNFSKPDVPNRSLLPKNHTEQKIWRHFVAIGWHNGITQANNIYAANLARLDRDYKGMALYRKLYAENMVSAPFVAKTELGVTGDTSQMSINDKVLRITALPALNLKSNTWKPGIVTQNPPVQAAPRLNPMQGHKRKRHRPIKKAHTHYQHEDPWIK